MAGQIGTGLMGVGRNHLNQAENALQAASELESRRNQEKQAAEAAHQMQKASLAGMGAAIGMAGGPWGAMAGAATGYILGSFL